MFLLVGLGNPGQKHQYNRHNIGFLLVDYIAREYNFSEIKPKFDSLLSRGKIAGEEVWLLKPQTYMNLSGKAMSSFVNFYKCDLDKVFVCFDDLDLNFLQVKIKAGGGTAGHNGLKSINSLVKNEYNKVKIGIGHPGDKGLVHKYVLADFSQEELQKADQFFSVFAQNLPILIGDGRDKFLNKLAMVTKYGI